LHSDPTINTRFPCESSVIRSITAKKIEIEDFIGKHIHLQYIPASRTSDAALEVVEDMIDRELDLVERSEEFQRALDAIRQLQRPVISSLQTAICSSMQQILPTVTGVSLELEEERYRSPVRARVLVDDGTLTDLEFKGDGMQSLAALSLI